MIVAEAVEPPTRYLLKMEDRNQPSNEGGANRGLPLTGCVSRTATHQACRRLGALPFKAHI